MLRLFVSIPDSSKAYISKVIVPETDVSFMGLCISTSGLLVSIISKLLPMELPLSAASVIDTVTVNVSSARLIV